MPLGTGVGLVPGDIVLDGDPAFLHCGQAVAHLSNCWALVYSKAVGINFVQSCVVVTMNCAFATSAKHFSPIPTRTYIRFDSHFQLKLASRFTLGFIPSLGSTRESLGQAPQVHTFWRLNILRLWVGLHAQLFPAWWVPTGASFVADHFNGSGRAIGRVCVCLHMRTIYFELDDLWPTYLACWFNLTLSRSPSEVKVIDRNSRSQEENVTKVRPLVRAFLVTAKSRLLDERRWEYLERLSQVVTSHWECVDANRINRQNLGL